MKIGVNFFGPKKKLYRDFDGTLEKLKAIGITSAELCISFKDDFAPPPELNIVIPSEVLREMSGGIWTYRDADAKIAAVRDHGFAIVSAHMFGDNASPEAFLSVLPRVKEFGVKHDIKCFVISLMCGYEGMKTFAPAVQRFAEELGNAGIMLAYHNHEMEFETVNGQTALDYLLEQCPALKLEPDVGWATFAGVDAAAFVREHKDRIILLHFKDFHPDACKENRDTSFTAVGEGIVPLRDVLLAARDCPILDNGIILDQDDSLTDILDDLAIGVRNLTAAAE